jgi:hypothetical protein
MLQDFRAIADDLAMALRDVWLIVYGELMVAPYIPLRCIATQEELKEAKEMKSITEDEKINMMRRSMGLSIDERIIENLKKENEKEEAKILKMAQQGLGGAAPSVKRVKLAEKPNKAKPKEKASQKTKDPEK